MPGPSALSLLVVGGAGKGGDADRRADDEELRGGCPPRVPASEGSVVVLVVREGVALPVSGALSLPLVV